VWNAERIKYGSCGDSDLYGRPQGIDEWIVLITNLVYGILNAVVLDSVTPGNVAWRLEECQDWRDWEADCFFIGPPTDGYGAIALSPEDDVYFHLLDSMSRHQKY
jgi:hypothetical protein